MRTPARSSSVVALGALVALGAACQKSGDALLYVTVKASPAVSGVEAVDVALTRATDAKIATVPQTTSPLHYPCPDGGVDIGSSGETLTVILAASAGPVTVTAIARGAGGVELSRGTSGPVAPQAGSITNVTVTLGSSEAPDSGAPDGAGGTAGSAGATGAGGGGAGGTGGAAAGSGGASGGGGASASGGGSGGGGASGGGGGSGTGGASGACVPKGVRDCTSSNDNDCNGQADDTETVYCQCSTTNSPRGCSTGMNGICMAGTQACVVAADKTSSAWGACVQVKAKGTETCANPGTDDDCNGLVDDVPSTVCNVGTGLGACLNNGHTGCNGTTSQCNPSTAAIGDTTSTVWHTTSAPNGSFDWNCDGVVTKQYPDTAPPPPSCDGLSMTACSAVTPLSYALNPFACGDYGDIGSEYCVWNALIPACTNKSGQSTGFQQGCR